MDGSALVLWWKICVVVGITVAGCHAGNKWQKSQQQQQQQQEQEQEQQSPGTSIVCYQCNSEYDPRCGESFDNYTLGTVNCSLKRRLEHLQNMNPVLCRKIVQKVQGKVRVIRGCGYIRDERDNKDCYIRTGTHDVHITYCACTESLCNTATEPLIISTLITILAAWVAKLMAY